MSAPIPTAVLKAVHGVRRRLFLNSLLNRVAVGWAAAMGIGLAWLLAEPWLIATPPTWLSWAVLGGLFLVGTVVAVWSAVRSAPTGGAAALELDRRFGLRERVTTAFALRPDQHDSPAAAAVFADADTNVRPLALASQFPVRLRWPALAVPALAAAIAAAIVFYDPDTSVADPATESEAAKKAALATLVPEPKPAVPFTKQEAGNRERKNKSDELKELEDEINKTMDKLAADPREETPEKQREKVTELTKLEDKVKKFEQEKFEKLARMEQQLQQLDKIGEQDDSSDGPADQFKDALAKGDLKKAQEEVDELKKKAKDKKLDPKDAKKLEQQLDQMADELKRLARNKEREEKLQEMINQAKKDGRDAESLERELEKLQQDGKEASEAMQQLAEQLQRAQQAAARGDMEDLAEQLERAGSQLQDLEGELQDLEDAGEFLQRLKEKREAACKACQGQGECDKPGDKDWAQGRGQASGKRDENKDAQTNADDERIRGLFDPRGQKAFGGSVRGQAFTKKTTADFGQAIQEAVQEAPQAADAQRLPRDAVDSVKEYFQNLGGQPAGGK